MHFSVWPSSRRTWPEIRSIAEHAEATGWDGLYFADHLMPHGEFAPHVDQTAPLDGDTIECWSVVAALAASVPRLRLGSLVSSVTFRHPAVLAAIAAAVDNISGGRLVLGVGAGWQRNEHTAYGIGLGTVSERLDRFEEALQVVTSLLRRPRTTFSGRWYEVRDAPNQPRPLQDPLPLLIGGGGERRTLALAARHADEWNFWATPETLRDKLVVLAEHCRAIDRDPSEIRVSTQAHLAMSTGGSDVADFRPHTPGPTIAGSVHEVVDVVARYREVGAHELIIPDRPGEPAIAYQDLCDRFIEEVAVHFA